MTDEQIARLFHETYERLAPDFGYKTREASAVPWEQVPEQNKALMIAVAGEVRAALGAQPEADPSEVHELIVDGRECVERLKYDNEEGWAGEMMGRLVDALVAAYSATPSGGHVTDHPEATCEDCGRPNISWSIDSDRWNFVTRVNGYWNGVLCPSCFVLRHEKVTGMTASWTLVPTTPFRWIEAVADSATPEGTTGV